MPPKYQDNRCEVVDQIIHYLDDPKYRRQEHADEIGSRDHQLHAGPEHADTPDATGPVRCVAGSEDCMNILLDAIGRLNHRVAVLERRCNNWIGD